MLIAHGNRWMSSGKGLNLNINNCNLVEVYYLAGIINLT